MKRCILACWLLLCPLVGMAQTLVTVGGPVYSMQLTRDVQNPIQVGTVLAGKPCLADQSAITRAVGQLYVIPHDSVTFFPATDAEASYAACKSTTALGSATLTWTPPTKNTDGSPFNSFDHYAVYWGTKQGTYPNKVTAMAPSYVVDQLASGTWFFVVTAVNTANAESAFSNVATKTIP